MIRMRSNKSKPFICIVDSDIVHSNGISKLLSNSNIDTHCFTSAEHFLQNKIYTQASCYLLEVHLPGVSGITLLEHLNKSSISIPTIIMASSSEVSTAVRAMQANAIDFLEKPFTNHIIMSLVKKAIRPSFIK